MKLYILIIILLQLFLSGCTKQKAGKIDRIPPNVLLITIDTLRADRLGYIAGEMWWTNSLNGAGGTVQISNFKFQLTMATILSQFSERIFTVNRQILSFAFIEKRGLNRHRKLRLTR